MKKILLVILSIFYFTFLGNSQVADSTKNTQINIKKAIAPKVKKDWPDPNKAILFAIIPGGGQVYNKRWWKVPLVYAAIGGGIAVIKYNRDVYLEFKEALDLERAGLPHQFIGTNATTLKRVRDLANRNMQQAYLITFGLYLLQATEAFVDAHLRDFDVSEDLSFKIKPNMEYTALLNQATLGLSISIPISR